LTKHCWQVEDGETVEQNLHQRANRIMGQLSVNFLDEEGF